MSLTNRLSGGLSGGLNRLGAGIASAVGAEPLAHPRVAWRFDGSLADASGNGHALTDGGANAAYEAGRIGQCVYPGGSGELNLFTDTQVLTGDPGVGPYTVAFWVRSPELPTDGESVSVRAAASTGGGNPGLSVSALTDDSGNCFVSVGIGDGVVNLDATLPGSTDWIHLAVTVGGGTASLYVDGALVNAKESTTVGESFDPLFGVGGLTTILTLDPYRVDMTLVYDFATTAGEVAFLATGIDPTA